MSQFNHVDNASFSKILPCLQTSWDSVSTGVFKTCPRKYQYEIIQGWQPKGENIHLSFGIYYHAALEEYDKALSAGAAHEEAARKVVQYILNLGTRTKAGVWVPWDTNPEHKDYRLKNRASLLKACVWYMEHFKDDSAKTIQLANGKPAVELSFSLGLQATASTNEEFIYCGHIDRLVEFGAMTFVLDRKTTKSTLGDYHHAQFNPNTQITGYIFAAQTVTKHPAKGAIIDAVQLMISGIRFGRSLTYRTEDQLSEWLVGMFALFQAAETCAQSQFYPMNETACGNYGGCPFRKVCGADEHVREHHLKSDFILRRWDPMIART